MNISQKTILAGATAILVCMILFPPWTFVYQPQRESRFTKGTRTAGCHLLFSANSPQDQTALAALFGLPNSPYAAGPSHFSMEIDSNRLMLQIGALIAVTALLLFLLKSGAGH